MDLAQPIYSQVAVHYFHLSGLALGSEGILEDPSMAAVQALVRSTSSYIFGFLNATQYRQFLRAVFLFLADGSQMNADSRSILTGLAITLAKGVSSLLHYLHFILLCYI